MASKGKQVAAGKGSSGKRKQDDSDKTGKRKRKNPGVLQFFDDAAYEVDDNESSDDSDFENDFVEDEFFTEVKIKNEPGKAPDLPIFPKEEEMSEEEFEKMVGERYKPGSSFVRYAEDETNKSFERSTIVASAKDPIIWKVKCMVGRERHSAFCLMQKYVDLHSLGTKLQIVSAFAVEHVKGFIYIEADRQCDVYEACNGLCSIYSSRVAPVPKNEVSHLFSVRSKCSGISVGMWARVKNGKYKGDLAQVVVVNDARKKATVKLIPRIDLRAMAEKFGGGVTAKKTATPAPRLISSSELEEFRPLIQYRRDRDTDKFFEVLDGMMLKDGYLYKKVPIDSLSFWGVMPSEDELLKFEPSNNDESTDLEWLSQLYGEQKKKRTIKSDKGGGKGEGSSSSSMENSFEVHDLVFFGRTGFGVIIGTEKDDSFKILKEGSQGPVVVNVKPRELKKASFDKKFTALDQHTKTISVNDTVRILEGPLEDRQGLVKHIYRGTVFLYDENEQENNGYFCSKAQTCEKIKLSGDACKAKGGEPGPPCFDDFSSSPKSPLSPKKPWQGRDDNRNFNREDKDGMFSVGQSLRIRVGPLKGYLCRVLAIRRSDITVKLDSQQKILTVKSEHLSEVRGRSSAISMGEDSEAVKPFDLLATQDGNRDWMDGAMTSADGEKWNAGGLSTERSSWPSFPASSFSLQPESGSANPLNNLDDIKKDGGDSAWETKVDLNQNSSWGAAVADEKAAASTEQVGGWGKSEGSWNKATSSTGFGSSASDSWGKAKMSSGDNQDGGYKKSEEPWDKGKSITVNPTSNWSNATPGKNPMDSRGKANDGGSGESTWAKAVESLDDGTGKALQLDSWGKAAASSEKQTGGWGNAGGSLGQQEESTSVGKKAIDVNESQTDNWGNRKNDGQDATGWGKGKSSWGKAVDSQDKATGEGIQQNTWGKPTDKWSSKDGPSGSKADWNNSSAAPASKTGGWGDAGSSGAQPNAEERGWKKATAVTGDQTENWGNKKKDGEDAMGWGKGGFGNQGQSESWNKPKEAFGAGGGSSWSKPDEGSSWNKQDGGSSWSKQAGGSSWSKQADVNPEDAGGKGFGGWNKGRMGDKDDTDRQGSWERPNSFEGGRGFGGRRGRGGGRGGRDHFGRGRSFGEGQSSGWSKEGQQNSGTSDGMSTGNRSWNIDQAPGGWGKAKAFDGDKKDDAEASGWKKAAGGAGDQTENSGTMKNDGEGAGWGKGGFGAQGQSDSWNKPKASGADGGSSWNKQEGGSSWRKQDGGSSWDKQDGGSSWNKQGGGSSWNNNDGGSSWSKQAGGSSWSSKQGDVNAEDESKGRTDQIDSLERPKSFGGGQAFGGWNKGRTGETDQPGSWERPNTFEGGRGSGGRRGRGGGRGGRDNFGRGRSYDQGQPSGWSKGGQQNYGTNDGTSMGNTSSWNSSQAAGGWGKAEAFDGGKKDDAEGSGWKKGSGVTGNQAENSTPMGNQSSWSGGQAAGGWGKAEAFDRGKKEDSEASGWKKGAGVMGNQAENSTPMGNQSSWNGGQAAGGWGKAGAFDGGKKDDAEASGWQKAAGGTGDQAENWANVKKDGKDATGWGKGGNWP